MHWPAMALGAVVLEVLGAATAVRSGREPETHAGCPSVRPSTALLLRLAAAAIALDRGDQMDRARGAFAACSALAGLGARRCFDGRARS